MLFLLLVPFACAAYVLYILGTGVPGLIGVALAMVMTAIVSGYRRWRPAERDAPLQLGINPRREIALQETILSISPAFREELAGLALLHAVLVDRAASEIFVQNKRLPQGVEVITRRRHLELLRSKGLYDRLGNRERDLLLLPDGHWPEATIDAVTLLLEQVRLLRWSLRIDRFLPTVGADLRADFKLATELVNQPELVANGKATLALEDLRVALSAAEQFFHRTWSEGVRRAIYTVSEAGEAEQTKRYADLMQHRESEDLLIAATLVGEAKDEEIRLATLLALRRAQVLRWVRSRMYGEIPPTECLEILFG